jgi:hypothetical protein
MTQIMTLTEMQQRITELEGDNKLLRDQNTQLDTNLAELETHLDINQRPRCDAYEKGWRAAAKWADRDDLVFDIGSPAYLKDMAG